MKKLWIILIAAAVTIGIGALVIVLLLNGKYKHAELKSCSVSTGGGMLGGYQSVTLKKSDGSTVLIVTGRETHADREITTTYSVDPGALDRVREIVNRYDLYGASKRPYSRYEVMDGESTTARFSYENGGFSVSDNQSLTRKMREGMSEVQRYLGSLAQGEGVTTVEPQTAMLYLNSGYTLSFFVADAFDGRLDEILSEETEVSAYSDCGIVLQTVSGLDVSDAQSETEASAGAIVYEQNSGQIILLYDAHTFNTPIFLLAEIEYGYSTTWPLIQEMEGPYRLYFN